MATGRGTNRGFSYHELLIMAAILALILAATLPTLQTAEIRANVARVRNDHRLYALAIKAYTVDCGRPPIGMNQISPAGPVRTWFNTLIMLTTPVAYMSTLPQDPFWQGPQSCYYYSNFPSYDGPFLSRSQQIRARGFTWSIYSLGHQRFESLPWIEDMLIQSTSTQTLANIYDPTNGTLSHGKIYHTNKGALIPPF